MTHEIEAAVADGGTSLFRFRPHERHVRPPGSPCANCGEPLLGPWCHQCGQVGEDFHRSTWKLLAESVEGLFHFDSRIWRTLPDLALHPGRLTRAYLDGHRAPQIPPLRLFLVMLLLLFFVGFSGPERPAGARGAGLSPEQKAKIAKRLDIAGLRIEGAPGLTPAQRAAIGHDLTSAQASLNGASPPAAPAAMTPEQREALKKQIASANISLGGGPSPLASAWMRERIMRAVDHPEEFKLILENWGERFAFLMLPISALLLSIAFIFQRRFYVFDHLIFSMHSLSFQGVVLSAALLLNKLGEEANWILLACPVHLFIHMRGVYGTGVFLTLARMLLLFIGSLVGFIVLMLGLVVVGLANLPA